MSEWDRQSLAGWHRVLSPAVLLAMAIGLTLGCGGPDGRSAAHVERADELLAEGEVRDALLELRSAVQLSPDDPALNVRVARLSLDLGYVADAVDHYREAHELDRDDIDITLSLATLLIHLEPEAVAPLIDEVLEREPNSVKARVVLVDAAIARGDVALAMRTADEARRLDPENPDAWWSLARAGSAQIEETRRSQSRRIQSPKNFIRVLEYYTQYMGLGGERILEALLAKADVLAGWPGHVKRASQAYRRALDYASKNGSRSDRIRASELAVRFGRATGRDGLVLLAARQQISIAPDYLPGWTQLVEVHEGKPMKQAGVYAHMLRSQSTNPAAHLLYAQHLATVRKLDLAVDHLRHQIERGVDEAVLLTGIANLQLTRGFPADARNTVDELEQKYPDRPQTQLVVARIQLINGRHDDAVNTLEALLPEHDSAEVQMMLARAALRGGNLELAERSITRAAELSRPLSVELRRLKARIHFETGDYERAAAILKWLQPRETLGPQERLMLAISYYETGLPPVGRKLLQELIERREDAPAAALELARRDGNNKVLRSKVRRYLEQTYRWYPDSIEVLRKLAEMDIEDGSPDQAMHRLHRAAGRSPKSADIYLLRGRLELATGQYKPARDDAERVLILDPTRTNEAMELLAAIYAGSPNPEATLVTMQSADENNGLSADRLALMGYLMLRLGDAEGARVAYERALAAGSQLTLLKNDLAFLLARESRDLDRAEQLAKEAANAPGESLAAVDTLGYVYLRNGKADAALWQFRFAADHAEPPVAAYYFHLGLALMELERSGEARQAFERALAIDPEFPDAGEARRQIGLLSAGAAIESPSGAEPS